MHLRERSNLSKLVDYQNESSEPDDADVQLDNYDYSSDESEPVIRPVKKQKRALIKPISYCPTLPTEIWTLIVSLTTNHTAIISLTLVNSKFRHILAKVKISVWSCALNDYAVFYKRDVTNYRRNCFKTDPRHVLSMLTNKKCWNCSSRNSRAYWIFRTRICKDCFPKITVSIVAFEYVFGKSCEKELAKVPYLLGGPDHGMRHKGHNRARHYLVKDLVERLVKLSTKTMKDGYLDEVVGGKSRSEIEKLVKEAMIVRDKRSEALKAKASHVVSTCEE